MASPLRTPLCDLLGIEYPIMQAGMGLIARADLCAAVSNAGGLGVIGGAGMSAAELRDEIRRVRDQTDRPFGVDLLLPMNMPREAEDDATLPPVPPPPDWLVELRRQYGIEEDSTPAIRVSGKLIREQVAVVLEERVPVFISGLGDPSWLVPDAHAQGMKVMGLVGTARAAQRVARGGADVVIAQGYDAGGHTGYIGTFSLIPQVVDAVSPTLVAAAGGIVDGRGIAAALALGAVGVWIGTRFAATEEARSHPAYKQRIAEVGPEDIVITKGYSGKTCRVIRNRFVELWEQSGEQPLPMPLQGARIGRRTHAAARERGITDVGSMPAGQGAGLIKAVLPAGEVVRRLVAEAEDALARLAALRPLSAR
jgi:NAD(P)H-dependent flavin oxidoreductase YrpB (nitropropane dioxygenase family)